VIGESASVSVSWVLDHVTICALVLARVLGLVVMAPALGSAALDWRFRLVLAAGLGAIIAPVVAPVVPPVGGASGLAMGLLLEVLTGGVLGWSAALIVAGARLGGDIVAAWAGLSTASLLDPDSGEELTPLGQFHGWIALAVFLALDGPLALVRALADSYRAFPAGQRVISHAATEMAFSQVGHALELALRIAAPPALALFLASMVLGWLGRMSPSLPLVVMAVPIRTFLGVIFMILSLAALTLTLSGAWNSFHWGV
jgi:flagellar biosynthetic protein FliR